LFSAGNSRCRVIHVKYANELDRYMFPEEVRLPPCFYRLDKGRDTIRHIQQPDARPLSKDPVVPHVQNFCLSRLYTLELHAPEITPVEFIPFFMISVLSHFEKPNCISSFFFFLFSCSDTAPDLPAALLKPGVYMPSSQTTSFFAAGHRALLIGFSLFPFSSSSCSCPPAVYFPRFLFV
jgi:hypothetical protein